jgi:hypothetical protein
MRHRRQLKALLFGSVVICSTYTILLDILTDGWLADYFQCLFYLPKTSSLTLATKSLSAPFLARHSYRPESCWPTAAILSSGPMPWRGPEAVGEACSPPPLSLVHSIVGAGWPVAAHGTNTGRPTATSSSPFGSAIHFSCTGGGGTAKENGD